MQEIPSLYVPLTPAKCLRDNCPYSHDKSRTDLCKHYFFYGNNGSCTRGENCDYRHDNDGEQAPKMVCKQFHQYGSTLLLRKMQEWSELSVQTLESDLQALRQRVLSEGSKLSRVPFRKNSLSQLFAGFLSRGPQLQILPVHSL